MPQKRQNRPHKEERGGRSRGQLQPTRPKRPSRSGDGPPAGQRRKAHRRHRAQRNHRERRQESRPHSCRSRNSRNGYRPLPSWLFRLGVSALALLLAVACRSHLDVLFHGAAAQSTTTLQVGDLIVDEKAFQEGLEQFVESLETLPAISEFDRQEVHRLSAYYRGRVINHLPEWLARHGYELTPTSQHALRQLRQQWQRLQADYAELASQANAKGGRQ